MTFFYLICLAGTGVFTYFLPEIWWDITWGDIFKIISNKNEAGIVNDFSKLLQKIGLTETNLHSWAIERLLICIGICIALIIFFTIIFVACKKKKKKN